MARDRLRLGGVVLLLALGLLGWLQYRWLREVAEAQRNRMRADAAARASAAAQDFDREITRAFLMLPVDAVAVASRDAGGYADRYEEFRRAARWPGLVRDVFVVEAAHGGRRALLRFSPQNRRLEPAEWPAELQPVRERVEKGAGLLPSIAAEVPALMVPVAEPMSAPPASPPIAESPAALHHMLIRRAHAQPLGAFAIVLLDRNVLTARVLPEILAQRLGVDGGGAEYDASVVELGSGAPVYGSDAGGGGDAQADLFRLRLEELDTAILRSFVPDALRKNMGERISVRVVEGLSAAGPPLARWRLVLRHQRGSVDRAVQDALTRNLAIGFSVLALLGGSAALVAASARRERALAARQLEFVAAVTHELRTPLSVIRSAGENLADGVVDEPSQVRRYGGLVRDEGLRLSEIVEQVLSFAGAQAPARARRPVDPASVVERAVASEAREGWTIERNVAADLPAVLGDAAALERAVANLVSNARKYGGPERTIAVRARAVPDGAATAVALTVSDRGAGIDPDERGRLFEPFFRGRRAREAQAPGSGLGLAIVRRIVEGHGGRVEVDSVAGGGAAFTIVLPAAPAVAAPASDVQAHPAR
jgi:signal transduction histidine kinase